MIDPSPGHSGHKELSQDPCLNPNGQGAKLVKKTRDQSVGCSTGRETPEGEELLKELLPDMGQTSLALFDPLSSPTVMLEAVCRSCTASSNTKGQARTAARSLPASMMWKAWTSM